MQDRCKRANGMAQPSRSDRLDHGVCAGQRPSGCQRLVTHDLKTEAMQPGQGARMIGQQAQSR